MPGPIYPGRQKRTKAAAASHGDRPGNFACAALTAGIDLCRTGARARAALVLTNNVPSLIVVPPCRCWFRRCQAFGPDFRKRAACAASSKTVSSWITPEKLVLMFSAYSQVVTSQEDVSCPFEQNQSSFPAEL